MKLIVTNPITSRHNVLNEDGTYFCKDWSDNYDYICSICDGLNNGVVGDTGSDTVEHWQAYPYTAPQGMGQAGPEGKWWSDYFATRQGQVGESDRNLVFGADDPGSDSGD